MLCQAQSSLVNVTMKTSSWKNWFSQIFRLMTQGHSAITPHFSVAAETTLVFNSFVTLKKDGMSLSVSESIYMLQHYNSYNYYN